MRKYSWLALIACLAFVFVNFISCNKDAGGAAVEIIFDCGEGYFESTGLGFKRVITGSNGRVNPPVDAVLENFKFREWNTDVNGHGNRVTSSTVHNDDTRYFAVWDQDSFYEMDLTDFTNIAPVLSGGSNTWTIEGADVLALKNAKPGSMLRMHFDATGGAGSNRNNWGVGIIGNGGVDMMDFFPLNSPPGAGFIYFIDVENNWLLEILDRCASGGDKLIVSLHAENGDMLQRALLLEPKEERNVGPRPGPPPIPANIPNIDGGTRIGFLDITYGTSGDFTQGKGYIAGDELQLMRDTVSGLDLAADRVLLRIWVWNTGSFREQDMHSWPDVGQIGGGPSAGGFFISGARLRVDHAVSYTHDQVLQLLSLNRDIFLNPYNGHIITLVEFWVVPYQFIEVKAGAETISDIVVTGRTGSVAHLADNTGYTFAGTDNNRSSYAWFSVDFGSRTLRDFKEVTFDYEILTPGTGGRRLALIASHQQSSVGGGNFTQHFTGGSNLGAPLGSNNGWLAAFQISPPMTESMENADFTGTPGSVTLPIIKVFDPATYGSVAPSAANIAALNSALDASIVFFSIFENTVGAAVRITNIEFVPND
jgi:hypothetical protein